MPRLLRRFRGGLVAWPSLGLALLLAGGCGAPDDLPPPGADRLVVVHWWDEGGGLPAYLQADRVVQEGAVFESLEFRTVLMRLPGADGVVYVTAPRAIYQKGAAEEVQLDALPDQPVDGPVRFIGQWNGEVFMGRANRAVFEEKTHRMRLDQVEIAIQGLRQRAAWAAVTQDRMLPVGRLDRMPDASALTAALAALPAPLVLPPIRPPGR
jgi:hypothetical protein